MDDIRDYKEINKDSWNRRADAHIDSAFYDVDGFLKGRSSLNDIELALLGDVSGKEILHLQCHFGQDTLSLGRMGAITTGVDISDKAIQYAEELANKINVKSSFICCDIYDLPNHLDKEFDIVFTSYGTIGWLPDINKWGEVVTHFLKPNGKFVFVEFHPVVWMFDDDFKNVAYNYFNSKAIVETFSGTYADKEAAFTKEYVTWNHGIGEVMNSLLENGLEILSITEYDYSPYDCFNHTVEFEKNKYRIKHLENKIPMVYAIEARKNA